MQVRKTQQKKILLLGGTSDAISLAKKYISQKTDITYSIAGLVRQPNLDCKIHTGGFQGNMADYLRTHQFDLLIDVTHPYAVIISQNAENAAKKVGIRYWQIIRPPWKKTGGDNWTEYSNWYDLLLKLHNFKRPFFAVGRQPLEQLDDISEHQHWLVRTAIPSTIQHPKLEIIAAIGGFSLPEELALFDQYKIDVLICKNSGGDVVSSKLLAAKQRNIPVLMQTRPSIDSK
jgi:precorrin-6A/cobalt-precorrin-6A reductase